MKVLSFAAALRHPRFRRVWLGQAVSAIGDGITLVVLPGAVLMHHSKAGLGLVLGAESLALVSVALLGGVLADWFRRTWVMAFSDLARLAAAVCLALGAVNGPLAVPVLLAAIMGFAGGIFTPAFGALIPDLVPEEDLAKANALRSITVRTGQVLGPALGGLLLVLAGVTTAFWVDAGTFAVSIVSLIAIGDSKLVRQAGQTVLRQAAEGFAAVRQRPWVLTIIVQGTVQLVLVMAPVTILMPIILNERHEFAAYGLVVALQAVGSVIGGMVIAAWKPRQPGSVAVLGLGLLGLQLLCLLTHAPLYLLGPAMVATGFGYAVFGVLWVSALQRAIPSEMLGRVFAIDSLGTYCLQPVGLVVAPIAATAFGNGPVLAVGLLVLAATTVLPLLQRNVRMLGDTARSDADPAAGTDPVPVTGMTSQHPNFQRLSDGGLLTVYLLPCAGGNASAFRPWARLFGPAVNVRAAQLPGRQDRLAEPCYTSIGDLVVDLADEIATAPPGEDFAFFGHSMGATLAFEVTRELRRRGHRLPALVGASGTSGPALARHAMPVHGLDEAQLAEMSAASGGLPEEIAGSPELLALVLPSLRADLAMLNHHDYAAEPPLPVPISIFGGEEDLLVSRAELAAWQAETNAGWRLRTYPGNHFYLWEQGPRIVAAFLADLDAVLAGVPLTVADHDETEIPR